MSSNSTCFPRTAVASSPPLVQNGKLVIQAHHIGWLVSALFTLIATATSIWLINKHLRWYTNKREQRYIVRILFMVPIYAIVSLASYLFWDTATPLLLIRDGYESTVLTSFFYLLLTYLSPDPVEQNIFRKAGLSKQNDREARKRGEKPKPWVFPLGFVKAKPEDGLYFLQMMKWGVLQYCVVRPTTTLAAVILNHIGLYCELSWSPGWGHVYILIVVSISVSVAMYCLIQLYMTVAVELKPYKPLLKLFAVKAVVFLTFWQASFLSLLSSFGVVKDTKYMTAEEINIGIGAIIETFEMVIFGFLHVYAFSYKPYCHAINPNALPTPRLKSLGNAMDFRETFRELWSGCVYIFKRWRGKETDVGARRMAVMEDVFGRSRIRVEARGAGYKTEKGLGGGGKGDGVRVDVESEVVVGSDRQWLGVGDDYAYGLDHTRRERSAGFAEQVQTELEKRGYPALVIDPTLESNAPKRHRSWWRRIYGHFSQDTELEEETHLTPPPERRGGRSQHTHHHSRTRSQRLEVSFQPLQMQYDDLPPQSIIETYRASHGPNTSRTNSNSVTSPGRMRRPSDPPPSPPEVHRTAHPVPPPEPLSRADTVFARVFPHRAPDSESSVDGRSLTNVTSSQSHATHVRLPAHPEIVPHHVQVAHMPKIVGGRPEEKERWQNNECGYNARSPCQPSIAQSRQTPSPRKVGVQLQPPTRAFDSDRRNGPPTPPPKSIPRFVPTRSKIVLPQPLSPSTYPSMGDNKFAKPSSPPTSPTNIINPQQAGAPSPRRIDFGENPGSPERRLRRVQPPIFVDASLDIARQPADRHVQRTPPPTHLVALGVARTEAEGHSPVNQSATLRNTSTPTSPRETDPGHRQSGAARRTSRAHQRSGAEYGEPPNPSSDMTLMTLRDFDDHS
ncbi:DUF300-domain-containing protein [Rickenella mellea]|uniref:DUF300-domain-containing protein n=1 Tax=Rickenella mellea TaxID=50990 RepID=A0A4Y7PYE9_9AGAM|nr:DUF300-domain-containing protein [Rickenella mellea]